MLRSKGIALILAGALGSFAWASPPQDQPQSGTAPATQGQSEYQALGQFVRAQIARLTTLAQEINLTQEQQDKLKEVFTQNKEQIGQHLKDVMQHRAALRSAILAKDTNEENIRKQAAELGKSIGDAAVFAAKLKNQAAPILTDDQRTALRRYLDNTDQDTQRFFSTFGGSEPARRASGEGPTTR
jgi:Spy/CpxP family protein refolding chaperone